MQPSADVYGAVLLESKAPRRWRLNRIAMIEAVVLPWAIFICVAWLLSSSVHYNHTWGAWGLVGACLLLPLGLWLRVMRDDPKELQEPNWFQFLAVVCLIAWLAGLAFGLYNWFITMEPYYESATLALISNVSTRSSKGGQFIDVAALEFTPKTDVNESLTMAYKDGRSYCVAPIVTPGPPLAEPPAFYEFWAVGIDCCNPFEPKVFMCGEPNDDEARGGLRLTQTNLIPYFRKAIQQAQEEYQIRAGENLVFLHWTGDPVAKINQKAVVGWANFRLAVVAYLVLSLVLVLLEVGHQKFS